MTIDQLRKRWNEHAARRPIIAAMDFGGGYLTLGAGTRLAKVDRREMTPREHMRLAALMTAAHMRALEASSLKHVLLALKAKYDGDDPLAQMHVALSRLGTLARPSEDARRLFFIDEIIEGGVEPAVIMKGLGLDPADSGLLVEKYSPDQPRVAAGNPDGGRWTIGNFEGGANAAQPLRAEGVQVADASAAQGIGSDALPEASPPQSLPGPAEVAPAQLAQDTAQTCAAYIAANCKASILRVFPGEFLTQTLQDVMDAAKLGNPAARTAKKLLQRQEYQKP